MRFPIPIVDGGMAAPHAHGAARPGLGRSGPVQALGPLLNAAWAAPAGPAAWVQQKLLADLAARPDDMLALSVALPFCAVHCLCCDRDVAAGQAPQALDSYIAHLCHEIDNLAGHIGGGRELMQLHLGVGSANLFSESCLVALMQTLRQHWRVPGDAELSVQCDPRRAGWVQLELLRGLGFGEVQFGVLDLDPQVQRAIGRIHSSELIDDVCGLARACGIPSINLGLMVGLPGQTLDSWRLTLCQVIAMAPGRITVHRYRHQPWRTAGQCALDAQALPDAALVRELMALTAEELGAVGYRWIGAELFVLEDDPLSLALDEGRLRSSLIGHTAQPPMPLLGVGRGAVSDLDGCLVWNLADTEPWRSEVRQGRLPVALAWQADDQALRRRAAAEHLLCHQELPAACLADDLAPVYEALAHQAPAGSLSRLDDRLVVTAAGRLDLPQLCAGLAGMPADAQPPLPAWLA
jgi:oxygen-independent coproporphyrinogen-3 oxidase